MKNDKYEINSITSASAGAFVTMYWPSSRIISGETHCYANFFGYASSSFVLDQFFVCFFLGGGASGFRGEATSVGKSQYNLFKVQPISMLCSLLTQNYAYHIQSAW